MQYEPPPLRSAKPADAPEATEILAAAFADDPVLNWALPDPRLMGSLFGALARSLYLRRGFGHIDGSAATLWAPPGVPSDPPTLAFLGFAARVFAVGGLAALKRMKRSADLLERHHPKTPHYYLFAVGVRPHLAGRGLGGRIIRAGLERADAEGAPAYLENSKPRNTPLYERLGFVAGEELRFAPDAPPLLLMTRPPRREI